MISENQKRIIDAISEEIAYSAWVCAAEQHSPHRDPDNSDQFMADRKKVMAKLRQIREELENTFTGVL